MVTGYKKKRLGHPSEKLMGDVPRAAWRAVLFSEILSPIALATIFVVAYMFVKSFPDPKTNQPNPSPLIRILFIAIGPMVWNAAVLLVLFLMSLFLGAMLESCCTKFGSVMALTAHILGLVGLVAFFEFFWFLELWNIGHAVLGLIAIVFIQRAIHKIIISLFLSREFKHDESNRAWWTGKWWGIGLGTHAMSQPAREFVVKIIELGLWSSDFVLCHIILAILTPPLLIPYADRVHATMLFWLRPSKQIRAPFFSTRQKRQRTGIVIRYGIIYLCILGAFAALVILPIIFRSSLTLNCSVCSSI